MDANTLIKIAHQDGMLAFEVNHSAIAGLPAGAQLHLDAAIAIVEQLARDGSELCPGETRGMLTCQT